MAWLRVTGHWPPDLRAVQRLGAGPGNRFPPRWNRVDRSALRWFRRLDEEALRRNGSAAERYSHGAPRDPGDGRRGGGSRWPEEVGECARCLVANAAMGLSPGSCARYGDRRRATPTGAR